MPRTTVVTGATAGVSRAVAWPLAKRGDDIASLQPALNTHRPAALLGLGAAAVGAVAAGHTRLRR